MPLSDDATRHHLEPLGEKERAGISLPEWLELFDVLQRFGRDGVQFEPRIDA